MGLLALCGALLVALACVDGAQVSKVAVLHRHGARTSFQIVDGAFQCSYPYCELTPEGIYQSRSVGKYLVDHYGATLGLSAQYNVSQIHSESTAVSRVSKSASAALMAMYQGSEALPYVKTVPLTSDEKMSPWTSIPAWLLSNRNKNVTLRVSTMVTQLATPGNIAYLEVYYGLQGQCEANPLLCVSLANDQVMCNTTSGAPIDPPIAAMLPQLQAAIAYYLSSLAGYFPEEDPMSAAIGSYGLPWVQEVVSFFQGTTFPDVAVAHYAAHDWTLTSILAALGTLNVTNRQDPSTIPRFAATILLEYYTDGKVKVLYGAPGQTPATSYTLTMNPLWVRCANLDGAYWSETGCPLEALQMGAQLTAGTSNLNTCYYTPDIMSSAQCSTSNQSSNPACTFFRQKCPNVPCGGIGRAIPDPARGYACQPMGKYVTEAAPYVVGTMLAVILPSLLLGGLIGGCGWRQWKSYSTKKSTTPVN